MTSVLKGKPGGARIISPRPIKVNRSIKAGNSNTSTTRSMSKGK